MEPTTSFGEYSELLQVEKAFKASHNLVRREHVELRDRKYHKEMHRYVLPKDTYTNPYFSKTEDRRVCEYTQFDELTNEKYLTNYHYQMRRDSQIINDTYCYMLVLEHNGNAHILPPMINRTMPAESRATDQALYVVDSTDYGYESCKMMSAGVCDMYTPPVSVANVNFYKDTEPRFRKIVHKLRLEVLDTPTREPIYIPSLNIVIGVTDNKPINMKQLDIFKSMHPMFAKPEQYTVKHIEAIKKEVCSSDDYRILVNDKTGKYDNYYVCINNVIVRVHVSHIESQDICLSAVYKNPSDNDGDGEKILDEYTVHEDVFKPCTTITIKSNKSNIISTHKLICGTDLKAVQDALSKHIDSVGSVGYTTEDLDTEVKKQTQVYKDKVSTVKQELERIKVTLKSTEDELSRIKELQKAQLLDRQQEVAMAVEQTKLQREIVNTRGKEVSTTGDMFKVILGACATIGGALLYYFANRGKEIIKTAGKVACAVGTAGAIAGGTIATVVAGVGAKIAIGGILSTICPPLGLLGLLF